MKRFFSLFTVLTFLTSSLTPGSISAEAPAFEVLRDITTDGQNVVIHLSGPAEYNAITLSDPERLVIDLRGVEQDWKKREVELDGPLIKRIRASQYENEPKIARVVLDLNAPVDYKIESRNSEIVVAISPMGGMTPGSETTSSQLEEAPPVVEVPQETPALTPPSAPVEPPAETPAPKPAKKLITKKRQKAKPAKPKEVSPDILTRMSKEPVSLDFQDADIRDVFRVLGAKAGVNIIYGSDVSGTITIHLNKVPFSEAFNTILTLHGSVAQQVGDNILRIITPEALATERSKAVTFTRVFPLNYSKAEDVKVQLDSIRSAEGRKGNIGIDSRTNSLIITDTPEGLEAASKLIRELDDQPRQVMIDAKIVELVLSDTMELGIQWEFANTIKNNGPRDRITIGGSQATDTNSTAPGAEASTTATTDLVFPTGLSTAVGATRGTGVNLPAPTNLAGISFGLVTDDTLLQATLSALASKGLTKTLANPRIVTVNNEEAKILLGDRIPFSVTTVTPTGSTQSTQFIEAGIKLLVTPTINVDKRITLKVRPEVSSLVEILAAGPRVRTREAQTTVLVENSETLVIGGLIDERDLDSAVQVPIMGDLPIIGSFFRRKIKDKTRSELLVFITPKLIRQ